MAKRKKEWVLIYRPNLNAISSHVSVGAASAAQDKLKRAADADSRTLANDSAITTRSDYAWRIRNRRRYCRAHGIPCRGWISHSFSLIDRMADANRAVALYDKAVRALGSDIGGSIVDLLADNTDWSLDYCRAMADQIRIMRKVSP